LNDPSFHLVEQFLLYGNNIVNSTRPISTPIPIFKKKPMRENIGNRYMFLVSCSNRNVFLIFAIDKNLVLAEKKQFGLNPNCFFFEYCAPVILGNS